MARLDRYRLVDFATQGYLLFVALLAAALRREHWVELVALHVGGMGVVHVLIASDPRTKADEAGGRPSPAAAGRSWLREFYPILLYTGLYVEIAAVNRMVNLPRLDPWLLKLDHALFGFQPAEAFPVALPQPLFSEFMHLSYLSYYLMVGGVGLWLSLRNLTAFRHFVTVVSLVFYACYATYLFVPAVGPRVLFADSPERAQFVAQYGREPREVSPPTEAEWARSALAVVEANGEIPGAAFPSSHVAVAFVTAWFSWKYLRRIRWLHLGFAVTVLLSTVYTRAHYAVDIIGGLAAAALLGPAAHALFVRSPGTRQTGRS